jgi:hypothetical protein
VWKLSERRDFPVVEIPEGDSGFERAWQRSGFRREMLGFYRRGELSFVPNLLPELAVKLSTREVLDLLSDRLGGALKVALKAAADQIPAAKLPDTLKGPVVNEPDGVWLKTANVVGINVRTIGTFWNVVKYVLTIPAAQNAIHLLPIWEPGVVGSLYGMSSWFINEEFFDSELAVECPDLDTVEKQLHAVIHILHALGRAVGMDVIPHTDRFSEIALAFPEYFEWLQRKGAEIIDHTDDLHIKVQGVIQEFIEETGTAVNLPGLPDSEKGLFSESTSEAERTALLFGLREDREGREARRLMLVRYLNERGFEPLPATMAPPYRGLVVNPESRVVDSSGMVWYDYLIEKPEPMSRVFGPLARYKLYGRLNNNREWKVDFDQPRTEVWEYVCRKYGEVQAAFGFDFMRGDMPHVQMRPEGVPETVEDHYDILQAVKMHIRINNEAGYFAYFAETFLAPRDVMTYGDESDHLDASGADVTLGDLQSTVVGSPVFLQRFRQYYDLAQTRWFSPCFTIMTGDKDDPRFDGFYQKGNEVRLFIGLFLKDMPSYMALGFETRDVHNEPAPNEHYTKLYVFQEQTGPKATRGPFVWGKNEHLFHHIMRLRLFFEEYANVGSGLTIQPTHWLVSPDATGNNPVIAWTSGSKDPDFLLAAHVGLDSPVGPVLIPYAHRESRAGEKLACVFSTAGGEADAPSACCTELGFHIRQIGPGEGRVYRLK